MYTQIFSCVHFADHSKSHWNPGETRREKKDWTQTTKTWISTEIWAKFVENELLLLWQAEKWRKKTNEKKNLRQFALMNYDANSVDGWARLSLSTSFVYRFKECAISCVSVLC